MKGNKLNTGKNHSLPHFTKEMGALKDLNKTKDLNISKEEQDSADLLSKICNFNSLVGKGILLCLQKQASLAQTLFDVLQECGIPKDKLRMSGQDKFLRPNKGSFSGVVSPRHESGNLPSLAKLQGFIDEMGLLLGNFSHEKEEKKIKPLEIEISLLASPSEHLNKSKDSQRSPKPSFSNRSNDVKRSSMPLVNISSAGENYSMTTRRKAESSLNFVNDQRVLTENMQIINSNRAIQSQTQNKILPKKTQVKSEIKTKSQALKLNLKNITSQTFAESKSKATSAKVVNNNKEATDFFYPPHIIKELQQQKEKENNNPLKSMRSTARDYSSFDMISPKPVTSTIPKKELFDESVLEHQDERDDSLNSSENLVSTPAIDTDRMFRTLDAHENSLLQSLNNLKTSTIPLKEKRTLKRLLQEEYGAKGNEFPRSDLGQLYEKKYIISAKWWRSWKEYVNFDSLDDSTSMINVEAYPRPGRLINRGLIKYDVIDDLDLLPGTLELKDHLLEHHDYEAVSRKVFDLLCKWYGCDFEIARCLKADPFRNNRLYLDLYPEFIEKSVKTTRLKSLSPRVDFAVENVISNIINTNLSDYQKKK